MTNKFIRHGDIGFVEVEKVEGELVEHKGMFVVGYGETTGHKHVLTVEKEEDMVIMKDKEGRFYFKLLSEGSLTHEEHKTIKIPPGIYRKEQENEVDHFMGSVSRKVID